MSFDRQLDVFGDEHDIAPAHERMRLFEPVKVMPGQTGMDVEYVVTLCVWNGSGELFRSEHAAWADADAAETLVRSSLPNVRCAITDAYGSYVGDHRV